MNEAFRVHKLSDKGLEHAQRIAEAFDGLLAELEPIVDDGRCLAIVRTKLEEACFFAKKGMAAGHSLADDRMARGSQGKDRLL